MIDLNEEKFDNSGGDVTIFNDGVAGRVTNVTLKVSKKTPEDKENSPDYKLEFIDSNGGICNTPFWYVTEDSQYATIEKQIEKQGKILKHLVHAIIGKEASLPKFENATQMLDGVMKLLNKQLKVSKTTFNMFATYGTVQYPKQYIQPRSWVPFIEPSSVSEEETRLKPSLKIDQLDRIESDNSNSDSGYTTPESRPSDDDDDWD